MTGHNNLESVSATRASRHASLTPLVHEVNEVCIEWMALMAASNTALPASPTTSALGAQLRALTLAQRRRMAGQPFLFVDLAFDDPQWWTDAAASLRTLRKPRSDQWTLATLQLTRTAVTLAWHCLHSDVDACRILFGMHAQVARIIAGLRLADIDRLAAERYRFLRPRWDDRLWWWRLLLKAAHAEDPATHRDLSIHALQLLTSETVPRGMVSD